MLLYQSSDHTPIVKPDILNEPSPDITSQQGRDRGRGDEDPADGLKLWTAVLNRHGSLTPRNR